MKKKIYIIISIVALTIISCGQNSFEKELNGKWYGVENDGFTRFFFYADSLVITELGPSQNVQWTANESKIEFDHQMLFDSISNTHQIDYILSKSKDKLFCTFQDSTGKSSFSLIRANNYLNFLSKKSGIDFELPSNNQIEHFDLDEDYGFKIFIGTKNGVLKAITEYGNELDSLESDLLKFKQRKNPQDAHEQSKLYHESHYRIFADKSISDEILNEHIKELNESKINKGFRIYESEEYKNLGYLRGERIKTIASNTYSK